MPPEKVGDLRICVERDGQLTGIDLGAEDPAGQRSGACAVGAPCQGRDNAAGWIRSDDQHIGLAIDPYAAMKLVVAAPREDRERRRGSRAGRGGSLQRRERESPHGVGEVKGPCTGRAGVRR
jgi:hypothetical protein